ncbi:MAG: DUF983 domain-containing protein [Caulobacter sp.]|nr:DUF983 domain-containing protein [Caulobacter sp.]
MTSQISETAVRRPIGLGIKRGLRHRCPNCGEGQLFGRYLKVEPNCAACGHDLSQYRADDGPAYLTILLVGHLIIGPLFFFPFMWELSPWIVAPVALISLTAVVLLLLPRIKGGFLGLMWANRITEEQIA